MALAPLLWQMPETTQLDLVSLQKSIYESNLAKGFWAKERNEAEILCLIHSELSEALEAIRSGNGPSEKIPAFSGVEEELADAVIRILDYSYGFKYDLFGAIAAKVQYNNSRSYMHGRKF